MARRRRKKCECPSGEKWAVPYADFLSLLLALFIALYALASVNVEKQKALKEEFFKIFNLHVDTSSMVDREKISQAIAENNANMDDAKDTFAQINSKLNDLETKNANDGNFEERINGALMSIPAQLLFEDGRADIKSKDATVFFSRLAKIITVLPKDTQINVKGYAEDYEIKGSNYKDALDLSTARANNVIRELLKYDIPAEKLYSSGFGSTKLSEIKDRKAVEFEFKTTNQFVKEHTIDDLLKDN